MRELGGDEVLSGCVADELFARAGGAIAKQSRKEATSIRQHFGKQQER